MKTGKFLILWGGIGALILIGYLVASAQTGVKSEPKQRVEKTQAVDSTGGKMTDKVEKSEQEWKELLSPQQYCIAREKGTEAPFTGKYWDNHEKGVYKCACCGNVLFSSDTKYDSGSGWPSFWAPMDNDNVTGTTDRSHGMVRTEITCSRCGAHLGHVFNDGPEPTGLRYCINSASLEFVKDTTDSQMADGSQTNEE
jgi:peptide-methionine (R)-S-oxide reductase